MTTESNTTLLGAYIGVPGEANATTQYNSFTSAMGQAPTVLNEYVDPSQPESDWAGNAGWSANLLATTPNAAATIPDIGIPMAADGENADASFQAIASGSEDAVFNGIFQAYASAGFKNFYIRPGWEMNGNWYPWSVTSSDAADFVAAFQHIASLAHNFAGASIKVVWNPAYSGFVNYNSIYPGNQAVDVIGMDTYGVDAGGTADSSTFDTSTAPTDYTLKDALAMAVANGKPFALPEVGAGTNDTTFPANVASVVAGSGAQVAFVSIWDDPSGGNSSLYWSDTPSTAAAWKQAFATIAASSSSPPSQTPTPTPAPTPSPTPTPTPTPSPTPSPNGTEITSASASPIIDHAGNAWTLVQSASVGLQIAVNGTVDPVTANVVLLETLGGNIVQENTSGNWYSEPGISGPWTQIAAPTPTPTPTPSPNGTEITSASASPIIDHAGNAWTLVQSASVGLQIAVNGTVDPVTANVVLLETLGGNIVQENTSGNWYSERSVDDPWTQISPPSISVTANATGQAYAVSGATDATTQTAGATFVLTAPGVATVTLGATADTLKFIGMSAITLTGGSAPATVVADGGTNSFTAASGSLTITGGAGADRYVYHKGDGLMMVKDFALSKGDTLTVDKVLQSAMTEGSDGHGGIILSFGSAAKGVDLVGLPSLATSQIHFV